MSRVPLRSTVECKYRGKPLSLRMNLGHMHDRCVKDKHAIQCHIHRLEDTSRNIYACVCGDLPCPAVNVIAVEVVNKAVFVGRQCLIASMNIHTAAGTIIRAAVAITSLGNGTFGFRYQPCVGFWKKKFILGAFITECNQEKKSK